MGFNLGFKGLNTPTETRLRQYKIGISKFVQCIHNIHI